MVYPLQGRTSGAKVEAQAAVHVLDQILKLVGKPPSENDKPGSLEGVLDEAGKTIAGKADKHLASLAVSFIEQPQYRLAGADEALAQISEKLKTAIDALQGVRHSVAAEVRESYARLFPLIGALNSATGLGRIRKTGLTAELIDELCHYPKRRLRLLVLDTALSVFRGLEGNCPEYSRDVQVCRARIGEFIAAFEADPATVRRAAGYEAYLLPPGCKRLTDLADAEIAALPPEDILTFEQGVQDAVTSRFKALVNVCVNPADGKAFVALLRERASAFLARWLEAADPAELYFKFKADDPKATDALAAAFDGAGPDVTTISGKAPAEATLLAAPASPAGDQFRAYVAEHLPGIEFVPAALPAEVAFFREYPVLPMAGLPQLAAHAKGAFDAQSANGTPHSRSDVTWQPPTTPP
jgi:hypothetical protein